MHHSHSENIKITYSENIYITLTLQNVDITFTENIYIILALRILTSLSESISLFLLQAFLHRVVALIMMCLLGFGSYFCFDNPGALQTDIKVAMNLTTAQFANLYSWYSWPNVVLPVVGGFLMDRVLGIRLGTMVFAFIICIGQGIFALGGFMDRLWLMELGRWETFWKIIY